MLYSALIPFVKSERTQGQGTCIKHIDSPIEISNGPGMHTTGSVFSACRYILPFCTSPKSSKHQQDHVCIPESAMSGFGRYPSLRNIYQVLRAGLNMLVELQTTHEKTKQHHTNYIKSI